MCPSCVPCREAPKPHLGPATCGRSWVFSPAVVAALMAASQTGQWWERCEAMGQQWWILYPIQYSPGKLVQACCFLLGFVDLSGGVTNKENTYGVLHAITVFDSGKIAGNQNGTGSFQQASPMQLAICCKQNNTSVEKKERELVKRPQNIGPTIAVPPLARYSINKISEGTNNYCT